MDWQIEGQECLDIISTSYEDLPSYLKPCFMYIASFPEDYKIKASSLTRLWIAEGFIIHHDPTRAIEEIAQSYLEELVQRCMFQVSERSWSGRIKHCYIHDILRELAVQKAAEENFLLIFSKSNANSTSGTSTSARRIAFHEFGSTELPKESIIGPKLRSLISFGDHFPNIQKLRMVRVIHSENSEIDENLQRMKQSTTLRYFRSYTILKLPNSFWNNKMLRYVRAENYSYGQFVSGPSSSVKLENLEVLKGVFIARDEWTVRFPHFPRIRKLGIKISNRTNWEAMANSITKLENLESLFLGSNGLSHPVITHAFKDYERMHSLYLCCLWPGRRIGDSSLFPPRLLKLTLRRSFLEQDPMQELEKLSNLRVLRLLYESYKGEQLICSAGGFRRLQQLKLHGLSSLKELKVEDGAMPLLKQLEISYCIHMEMLPDLQYLTRLEELKLKRMLPAFNCLLEGPDRHKVEHIPSISI
ncbi:hypothetical protein LUZ63_012188 [Rhynchospora breviuscula]|uniref:Uncharacterized protein n=1 Tax=Rhynchospora breviuscula TaxID=2022672 RepID=A0A9Q0HRP9_9POAL|nr:hypothetical protein LUZ63_012188 [Rhynchospora breviuscula]